MLIYFRYALATVCFAASVGCLALWGWSTTARLFGQIRRPALEFTLEARDGYLITYNLPTSTIGAPFTPTGPLWSESQDELWSNSLRLTLDRLGRFTAYKYGVIFPLWYPALLFALAGVAALRFRRQFTIRSALVVVSVVAALLGMAVVL